jgi:hypothetical protein
MIDFQKSAIFKLSPVDSSKMLPHIQQFLIDGEQVLQVFQTVRDQLVFTNKRIIVSATFIL